MDRPRTEWFINRKSDNSYGQTQDGVVYQQEE